MNSLMNKHLNKKEKNAVLNDSKSKARANSVSNLTFLEY